MGKTNNKNVMEKNTVKKVNEKNPAIVKKKMKNPVKKNKNTVSKAVKEYVRQEVQKNTKRIENIENEFCRDYALIFNLVINVKKDVNGNGRVKAAHVLRRESRFEAVFKFLDVVVGDGNYLRDMVNTVDFYGNQKKGILRVKMGSNLIDRVIENHEKFSTVPSSKKNKIVRFERMKSVSQMVVVKDSNEMRKRLIDYLYYFHDENVDAMPSVHSRNGKIKIGDAAPVSIDEIKSMYDLDYSKPLKNCFDPFKKNSEDVTMEEVA